MVYPKKKRKKKRKAKGGGKPSCRCVEYADHGGISEELLREEIVGP